MSILDETMPIGAPLETVTAYEAKSKQKTNLKSNLAEFGKGFVKSAGSSAINLTKTLEYARNPAQVLADKALGLKTPTERLLESKPAQKFQKELEPTNQMQKYGSYAETAAEFAIPVIVGSKVAKTYLTAKNALKLNPSELAKVNKRSLEWLSEKALRKGGQVGGGLTKTSWEMPKQLDELTKKFGTLFRSSNPLKNREAVRSEIGKISDDAEKLFEGNTRAMNFGQVKNRITDAVHKEVVGDSVYNSMDEKAQKRLVNNVVSKIQKFVKEGTNKGIYEARKEWRKNVKNLDGNLSEINSKTHRVLQNFIKDTLPPEKRVKYQKAMEDIAQLYDVDEILTAKAAAKVGKSVLKSVGKGVVKTAGGIGAIGTAGYLLNKLK